MKDTGPGYEKVSPTIPQNFLTARSKKSKKFSFLVPKVAAPPVLPSLGAVLLYFSVSDALSIVGRAGKGGERYADS
jgi:hypothetical protein